MYTITKQKNKVIKYHKMKKSQIKMFETIAVLVVFFFLIVASATVYLQIQKGSQKKYLQKTSQQESLELLQKALSLPELDCSFSSVQKENCFDIYKIDSFSQLLTQEHNIIDYFPVFGYSEIKITTIYPEKAERILYLNKPEEYSSKLVSQSPILLYNATTNTYSFAVAEVNSYVQ